MSEVAVQDNRSPVQILTAQVRSPEFGEQVSMALPEGMPPSRFVRATVTALLQNPELALCDPDSLFSSVLKAAQDGLLPDGREAAITWFNDNRRNVKVATYMPMIGGYRKIAAEHGWTIQTVVVYAADEFSYELGLDPRVDHRPAPINSDRGDLVAAYAIGRHRDGRREVEVYEAKQVASAKSVAKTDKVWKQWPAQMWEKTVGKRLFAKLPLDPADKRVKSLVDAEQIGPAASAEMLYGPQGQTFAAREITQDSSDKGAVSHAAEEGPRSPTPPAGGSDDQAPGLAAPSPEPSSADQQADTAASSGNEPPAPPTAPGFQIPDAVIDAAGRVAVQDGWSIASVCVDKAGRDWAVWALSAEYDGTLEASVIDALQLFVEHRHPDIKADAEAVQT